MIRNLLTIGINHDSASVALREQVAFAPERQAEALTSVIEHTALEEAVILSTCNRTEVYGMAAESEDPAALSESVMRWVADFHGVAVNELATCTYRNYGEQALVHLTRVAAGLNSMVLGEPQIFGQLKSAYAVAEEAGAIGGRLSQLFPAAFRVAKKVRTDTAIGENPVSVAYASVDLTGHIFSDLASCTALVIGAGETIELVARHLKEANLGRLIVANRTLARAEALARQFNAEEIMLADVPDRLAEADIVISSTGSQLPILGKGAVERALKARRWRPMLMVDLAVPRDIEPQVSELSDVYLYTVDDLRDVIEENLRLRASEASKADEIIAEGIAGVEREFVARRSSDVVRSYRESALAIQHEALTRAHKMLEKGESPEKVLERLARDLTNKLIHAPTAGLRQVAQEGDPGNVSRVAALLGVSYPHLERDEKTTLQ
ncbi:glutamyl-tRNA reductase [Luminiphilus syltensis NOR5-1B]|uniref:Glutamyl-tRNA reductase n=1 Tax=Luminiphilus syltensis NOR5-1B TaxID=565045 RepID=B8KRA7_9GAMM|nr:glutamyl-tRNA reductase [Luminiphilus syltensis]EED36616.1 glutamyl-tRNA reductase [Luminiphilus syltensis NOR5-1B]